MNLGAYSIITRFGDSSGTSRLLMRLGRKWNRQVSVHRKGNGVGR